jgi:hypothetical protein
LGLSTLVARKNREIDMEFTGPLEKMATHPGNPVTYYLALGDNLIKMNDLIGKKLHFTYLNKITCFCGMEVSRVFRQNFCYDCFMTKPEAGPAILRPELSQAHLGIADRDLKFEEAYQLRPHVVYLADSGGLKVGVTRKSQIPTRWIDQGASQAIVLADTENRYKAGVIEVFLKDHLSDKTHWQRMLRADTPTVDLQMEKARVTSLVTGDLTRFLSEDNSVTHIFYPIDKSPEKIKSIKFATEQEFEGTLSGIRGQYLIFESGHVTNIRSQEGVQISIKWHP